MPYANVPAELTGKMDSCVEQVQAQGYEKEKAIAICYASLVEGVAMPEGVVFKPELVQITQKTHSLEAEHTGVMVAFYLPDEIAQTLAVPGGENAQNLHLTLAYLGEISSLDDPDALRLAVSKWASAHSPISGQLNGVARFNTVENTGKNAIVALFDSSALPEFHQELIDTLKPFMKSPQNHGFTPHITLAYIAPDAPLPVEQVKMEEITFTEIVLALGDTREAFVLAEKPVMERQYIEANVSPRGEVTGREWDVTIVGPATDADLLVVDGREYIRSKNGRLYACDALRDSAPMWEGVKVFDNHLTDAEFEEKGGMRSVASEWVGVLTRPRWDEQARKLCATLKIVDNSLAEKLRTAWDAGVLNAVGLSMDTSPVANNVTIEGRRWPAVEGFQKIHSVDLVSEPAAGGGFNRLIAAEHTQEVTMLSDEMKQEIMALIKEALAAMSKPEPPVEPEVEEAAPTAPAAGGPPKGGGASDLAVQVKMLEAQQMVDRKLARAKLSEDAANLVREQLAGRAVEAAEVDRLIEGVRKLTAARDGSGDVKDVGAARIEVGMDKDARAEVEFLRLAAGNSTFRAIESSDKPLVTAKLTPALASWVKSGRPYYGTRRLSEWVYQYLDGNPMTDQRAYEALTTSNMSSIVKNALNVMLANAYSVREEWWAPIVTEEEVDTIDQATLVRTYGVSTLSTVNEGNAYTELNWRDDEETASFVKKGNYVAITLETLLNDKLNVVRSIPTLLANAWYNTLSGLVSSVFTTNTATGPVLADTGALFNATAVTTGGGHANLLTAALSYTAYDAVATAMMKQSDQYAGGGTDSGRRLMIEPKFLLVPVDLRGMAYQIQQSEEVPGGANWNPNQYMGTFQTISVPDWTDANNWAAVGDKARFPAIWLIFLRGKKVPELFTSDQETQGAMFTNDELRYKVRMMTWQFSATYTCAPVSDFRALHKSNVGG